MRSVFLILASTTPKSVVMNNLAKITATEIENWGEQGVALCVVDREHLHQLSEGDEAFELELLQTFIEDAEERLRQVHIALTTADGLKLKRQAHKLRGASAGVGVVSMQLLARRLEQEGQDHFQLLKMLEARLEEVRIFTASLIQ